MALGGGVALLLAIALLPPFGEATPRWAWRFFILWCVGVPYWHWVEWRWLCERSEEDRAEQALSRAVWFGGMAVLGAHLLAGAR